MDENGGEKKAQKCAFCEAIDSYRIMDAISVTNAKKRPEELEQYGVPKSSYSVAIVRRMWWSKIGKKGTRGSADFRRRGMGYKLNFCPECGRKISGRKMHKKDVDIMLIK